MSKTKESTAVADRGLPPQGKAAGPASPPRVSARRRPGVIALSLGLITAGLTALSACSNDRDSGDSAKPSAMPPSAVSPNSPSPSPSTSESVDQAAVLNAYSRMWDEQVKAYAKGDTKGTDLSQYAAALALSGTEDDLKDLRSKGIVTTGAPAHKTAVDALEMDKKVPHAMLTDCMDSANWEFVYRKSGKPVEMPKDRLVRYVTKVEAEKWGKQWKIVDVVPQQRAC
ncbi:hypothetical protein OG788_46305 [Streptomyces sp. NBC_00647]|uniref:hypothetical protein n=1 Tax=Streptomyces sp. NBC_00647 TaxID=2975796 RepID=UPI00324E8EDB